jgi:hypothetical protein
MEGDHDVREAGGRGSGDTPVPLGQRLYDSPFLLLAFGLAVMVICFTLWGLWEILSLPTAPLP